MANDVSDNVLKCFRQAKALLICWQIVQRDEELLDLSDFLPVGCRVLPGSEREELLSFLTHLAVMLVLSSLLLLQRVLRAFAGMLLAYVAAEALSLRELPSAVFAADALRGGIRTLRFLPDITRALKKKAVVERGLARLRDYLGRDPRYCAHCFLDLGFLFSVAASRSFQLLLKGDRRFLASRGCLIQIFHLGRGLLKCLVAVLVRLLLLRHAYELLDKQVIIVKR